MPLGAAAARRYEMLSIVKAVLTCCRQAARHFRLRSSMRVPTSDRRVASRQRPRRPIRSRRRAAIESRLHRENHYETRHRSIVDASTRRLGAASSARRYAPCTARRGRRSRSKLASRIRHAPVVREDLPRLLEAISGWFRASRPTVLSARLRSVRGRAAMERTRQRQLLRADRPSRWDHRRGSGTGMPAPPSASRTTQSRSQPVGSTWRPQLRLMRNGFSLRRRSVHRRQTGRPQKDVRNPCEIGYRPV
jgi:hypothetical protein